MLAILLSVPFTQYVVDCSLRAAMPNVKREALGDLPVWFPDRSEQDAILEHVSNETATVGAAFDAAKGEIELLREYRARLIADVVTGKLDVRAAAAALPDEAEEGELIDDADELTDNEAAGQIEGEDADEAAE